MVGRKLYLQIQSINIVYPKVKNIIFVPIIKRIDIFMGIQVCLISRMNFYHKENGGKKAFLANPTQQYRLSQCREHDCHANNKKNRVCYEYPSLSQFINEL